MTPKPPLSRRSVLKSGAALLASVAFPRNVSHLFKGAAAGKKRIYIAPDDHTDYFWTEGEDKYRDAFLAMIDYYLNLADTTAGNPPEHQSRWNCDGSFWLWTYQKYRPADFQRLINRIKDGHFSAPMTALVSCEGGAPAEAVLRGLYYAGKLERAYDLRFRLAVAMENHTLPYGLIALWAGAGAKYTWKGICGCGTRLTTAWDRQYEIYYAMGPDNSRVLMKWNSMLVNNEGIGGYAEARNPAAIVDFVDTDAGFIARYPYEVIGAFGKGWDDLQTTTNEFVNVAKSKTTNSRLVRVSNEEDFFQDFEATYSANLPTLACSFGNEWDLYCAALAEVSASVKRSVERLRWAEAMATLVSLKTPAFMTGRENARDQAWMDLGLFWEHNFGMVSPPSGLVNERIAWQRRLDSEIKGYVNTLSTDSAVALGGLIKKSGVQTRFFAFNPLSWQRSDIADYPFTNTNPVHVVDLSTGLETPSQIVTIGGQRYLRVFAKDIPAMGYKVFEIQTGPGESFTNGPTANGGVIENSYYRLTLDGRGAITSLIDKSRQNREFVPSGAPALNDLGPGTGALQVENAGPVSVTLVATASGPLNHTTRLTLLRDSRRIAIQNDINQNFDDIYTWGFRFALTNPTVWHEEVGAVIQARLLSNGGHYSDRNARYDWLTLNHFADMSSGSLGVTLSNADCYFMQLGNSTVTTLDTTTPQIKVLAGGKVVNGNNGLPAQGGDTHFLQRFALTTHDAFDPVTAMKFALEHQNPLITGEVTGGNDFPEVSYSFVTIDNPNVLLWALKPAEEGIAQGIIARLWNLSSNQVHFTLRLGGGNIQSAQQVTHIETPIRSATVAGGALDATIAKNQLKTYLLQLSSQTPPPLPGGHPDYLPVVVRI